MTTAQLSLPEGKFARIIKSLYLSEVDIQRESFNGALEALFETLDNFPVKPVDTDPEALAAKMKQYREVSKKIKDGIKAKYNEFAKLNNELKSIRAKALSRNKEGELEPTFNEEETKQNAALNAQLYQLRQPLSKTFLQIFDIWDKKKALGKGHLRIGKHVCSSLATFVGEVVREMLSNAIIHLETTKLKTLTNKNIFLSLKDNKFYPLYQNMPMIKLFLIEAQKELENEQAVRHFNKEKSSFKRAEKAEKSANGSKQAKKDKPSQPSKPSLHAISYDRDEGEVKFKGVIFKMWNNIKGEDLKMSDDAKRVLSAFVYEFTTSLVKSLKVVLDSSDMLTFKVGHVYTLLKVLSTLHGIEMNGSLSCLTKLEKKDKDKEQASK